MQQRALPRFVLFALLLCAGCAEAYVGTDPPADGRFYYPGRMALSQDESTVYIVNTNFDQQFTAGWVSVLDTNALIDAVNNGTDPSVAIDPNLMLKVPALGGQLVLDPNHGRAYLPSRSNGLLTTIDIENNTALSCGDSNDDSGLPYALRRTSCAADHLFNFTESQSAAPNNQGNNNMVSNFSDPQSATLIAGNPSAPGTPDTLLAVGFMSSQYVAIMDPTQAPQPKLLRVIALGNTAVLSLTPGIGPGNLIAGNHVVNNTTDRGVLYFVDAANSLASGQDVINPYNLNTYMGGFELSSLALNSNQLYVASRSPDALVSVHLGTPGQFDAQLVSDASAAASSSPTSVQYLARGSVGGDLVVMSSVSQDTLFFFSPQGGRLQLVQRVSLPDGQGPFDILRVKRNDKDLLLVTTFFDHGMSIIDITPAQPSQFKVVATIHQGDLGVAARFR